MACELHEEGEVVSAVYIALTVSGMVLHKSLINEETMGVCPAQPSHGL